jgi:hypothetical protein
MTLLGLVIPEGKSAFVLTSASRASVAYTGSNRPPTPSEYLPPWYCIVSPM